MTLEAADKSALEKGQAKPQVLLAHHLKALRLPTFPVALRKNRHRSGTRGHRPSALPVAPSRTRTYRT